MEKTPNDYHISFFKPTTPQAKANRNMVLWLVSIWFLAVFGFQIILRLIEKPTPEPAFTSFEKAWVNIENGNATNEDIIELGKSCLSVLGKLDVTPEAKNALENAVSWSVYSLYPDSLKSGLAENIQTFEKIKTEATNISDEGYVNSKVELTGILSPLLGLENDVRGRFLALVVNSGNMETITEESKIQLPLAMEKYLIHNQSVLTDFIFLGFPFHYFYTAVFLLILFVGLCWIYCVRTDAMNHRMEISE